MGYFALEKGQKFGNFRVNLVEFRVEKGPFLFATHCYIREFSGNPHKIHTLLFELQMDNILWEFRMRNVMVRNWVTCVQLVYIIVITLLQSHHNVIRILSFQFLIHWQKVKHLESKYMGALNSQDRIMWSHDLRSSRLRALYLPVLCKYIHFIQNIKWDINAMFSSKA